MLDAVIIFLFFRFLLRLEENFLRLYTAAGAAWEMAEVIFWIRTSSSFLIAAGSWLESGVE